MKDKKMMNITTEEAKEEKRKLYMKKYYARKKMERIKSGEFVSVCRGKVKREECNKYFTIRRGSFILRFE